MAFAPVFQRPFSATFDQRAAAAAAAAPAWYVVAGKTCMAAYQPKGAASLAASYINLANPGTNDAAPGVAPTFNAATGWTGDGLTTYLLTGIVPLATYTFLVRFAGATANRTVMGCRNGAGQPRVDLRPYTSTNRTAYGNGGSVEDVAGYYTSGVQAIAGQSGYMDGAYKVAIPAQAGLRAQVGILALYDPTGTFAFFAGSVQAAAIYDSTLSAPQVATVSAAMAAL